MKKWKEKLNAKLSKNGGFTLIEMLIVVAILAILIAVSIPLVGSALESAREATDAANERAFKAALVSSYLLSEAKMNPDPADDVNVDTVYTYDAIDGKVQSDVLGAGKGYGKSEGCKGLALYGVVNKDGTVKMGWHDADKKPDNAAGITNDMTNKLVSPGMVNETT